MYIFEFHVNWIALLIFNLIKIQYCVKITAIKFISNID